MATLRSKGLRSCNNSQRLKKPNSCGQSSLHGNWTGEALDSASPCWRTTLPWRPGEPRRGRRPSPLPAPSRVPSSVFVRCKTWINSFPFVARCRLRRGRDSRLPVITSQSLHCKNAPLVPAPALKNRHGQFAFQLWLLGMFSLGKRPTDGGTKKLIFREGCLASAKASLTPGLTPIRSQIGSLSCELMKLFPTSFQIFWGGSLETPDQYIDLSYSNQTSPILC